MTCELCTDPEGAACFPVYGLGPHLHAPDGTTILLRGAQMAGYREDPEEPGHGIHWCPACGDGKPDGADDPSPLLPTERRTPPGTCDGQAKHDPKCLEAAEDDTADFPLGKACDLSGEGGCESCQ